MRGAASASASASSPPSSGSTRSKRRRVVAVRRCRPGRTASGRSTFAPSRSTWSRCALDARAGRRRRARTAWSRPRPVGSASHARGDRPVGAARRRARWSRSGRGRSRRRPSSRCQSGPAGRRRVMDEVVGVRRPRARSAPSAVHPRVAGVAAREQPAVARRPGSRPGTSARHHVVGLRLLVDDRLDVARLAVAHVAEHDAVGRRRARHAQADDGLARRARAGRSSTYRSEPSWCGSSSSAPTSCAWQRHPLTEPAVRPLTIHRCRNRKSDRDRDRREQRAGGERPPGLVVLAGDEAGACRPAA